jgi:hypothetical protein
MGFQEYIAFTILIPCILSMRVSQLSLCAWMKFIMFLRFIISSSSWLVFIHHIPFSYFGPNIFLKIFLSNTNSLLIMVSFNIHVSDEYVTRLRYGNPDRRVPGPLGWELGAKPAT